MSFEEDKLEFEFERGMEAKEAEWREKIGSRLKQLEKELNKIIYVWKDLQDDEGMSKSTSLNGAVQELRNLLKIEVIEEEELEWQLKK